LSNKVDALNNAALDQIRPLGEMGTATAHLRPSEGVHHCNPAVAVTALALRQNLFQARAAIDYTLQ
jgi:hypothetical protein